MWEFCIPFWRTSLVSWMNFDVWILFFWSQSFKIVSIWWLYILDVHVSALFMSILYFYLVTWMLLGFSLSRCKIDSNLYEFVEFLIYYNDAHIICVMYNKWMFLEVKFCWIHLDNSSIIAHRSINSLGSFSHAIIVMRSCLKTSLIGYSPSISQVHLDSISPKGKELIHPLVVT